MSTKYAVLSSSMRREILGLMRKQISWATQGKRTKKCYILIYYPTQWTAEGSVFGAVCVLCLCMKYLGNRWTDLRQIHRKDVFGPSLGGIRMSGSTVKGQDHQEQKWHFSALSAACVRFLFGKTSLASTYIYYYDVIIIIFILIHYTT